jgi:hypothetical protein
MILHKLLLYFLDPALILGKLKSIDAEKNKRNFINQAIPISSNPIK